MHKFLKLSPGIAEPSVVEYVGEKISLEFLQSHVGGPIEYVTFTYEGNEYDIILHEEGKLIELPPVLLFLQDKKPIDIVVGDILIAKLDFEKGQTIGLSTEDIELLTPILNPNMRSLLNARTFNRLPYIEF